MEAGRSGGVCGLFLLLPGCHITAGAYSRPPASALTSTQSKGMHAPSHTMAWAWLRMHTFLPLAPDTLFPLVYYSSGYSPPTTHFSYSPLRLLPHWPFPHTSSLHSLPLFLQCCLPRLKTQPGLADPSIAPDFTLLPQTLPSSLSAFLCVCSRSVVLY